MGATLPRPRSLVDVVGAHEEGGRALSAVGRALAVRGPPQGSLAGPLHDTMLDVMQKPAPSRAHLSAAPDDSAARETTAGSAASAERSAFSDASDALQSHRELSQIWGDEREAVSLALHWAASHTAVATDPKTTARSAADLQDDVGATITEDGIGAARAMALFDEVLLPAT
ncbi:MAG: hypothetical protein L0H74_11820, partial [Brachybacterium sp.]|nr:hypothetical protein [Brachybacterium sp.]